MRVYYILKAHFHRDTDYTYWRRQTLYFVNTQGFSYGLRSRQVEVEAYVLLL